MRRSIVLPVFVACFMFAAPVLAADANTTHSEIKLIQKQDHTEIQLTQQAERMEARNRISASLNVEARGNNARQIQIDINKRMAAAIEKARAVSSVTVETGSYSVSRPYDAENSKDADRWRGEQMLNLTSDDFEAVLNLVGALQSDGLVMSDMHFFVDPDTLKAAQDDLTTAALQALKDRANHVAGDLGLQIERYKNISVGNASEDSSNGRRRSGKAVTAVAAKTSPPAIAAGDALVTLQVSATVMMAP